MHITLSNHLQLPTDAVTQKQAFLGMSGSGKTYGAGVFVEGLLVMGAQVVVLDVVGNWYGLRIGAKGTGEGFKIPVFGGDHGDIPQEDGEEPRAEMAGGRPGLRAACGGGIAMRPTREDRDALRLLLQREDLSDYNAEFVEALRNWSGAWTEKQCRHFDQLWSQYYA